MNASDLASARPNRPIRVVVSKVGLDGHDRGAKVVAKAFRDAGMDVIYAGLRRTADDIAEIVLQEDADVLGLSILSGAVVPLVTRVKRALHVKGLDDVLVLVGGVVPESTRVQLEEIGVDGIFSAGTPLAEIVNFVKSKTSSPNQRTDVIGDQMGEESV